ncbi:GDP-L-fucose synthase family protein [Coxiella burnetii]|uniref:GDP-L-fucose synthase n=5 Tax=Coxiella burnetii TaxID=777 RepID=H7C7D0_COXBU|nr:GDP-L-fucose synthase [Coxiella burnetii]NP_819718.1 GDP-L-fucose synthase [Coxiella burnetii RSA 493]AAK71267.1 GDP-4-keto-6 deoxymannose epimerase/reductase [Coxiella burnetii]AAO90232.1 GDP-L-fucose synthase [Coxiella burnetii RSA 493]ABS76712.1 GDP-L-fucose synthase [Coxiella burnetii Dugway 5J108-111]ABX78368.1 GDP-L-fucose synthase [Coxiella burnetii RSA 331]ACJ18628.1 GDP-L-fucose synthase [Coxiella burnetii CbuG_Q212]
MQKDAPIFVTGHRGLAGSAILRRLKKQGYSSLITRTHQELDLTNKEKVFEFFANNCPEYVFLAAARVGGINDSNLHPVDFIRDNLAIQWNVIEASFRYKVKRLLFLGSSCIYSNDAPRPLKEIYFNSGKLEPTNRAYSTAKIAGIEHCWAYNRQYKTQYLCAMPTNLFGPNDNYDLENGHVVASLISKIHQAKEQKKPNFVLWGSGKAKREFLYSDDLAEACCHLMNLPDDIVKSVFGQDDQPPIVNIGSGKEISIYELALLIQDIIGYQGDIIWDHSKPDGALTKVMDVSLMQYLGWSAREGLVSGIKKTYQYYLSYERQAIAIEGIEKNA